MKKIRIKLFLSSLFYAIGVISSFVTIIWAFLHEKVNVLNYQSLLFVLVSIFIISIIYSIYDYKEKYRRIEKENKKIRYFEEKAENIDKKMDSITIHYSDISFYNSNYTYASNSKLEGVSRSNDSSNRLEDNTYVLSNYFSNQGFSYLDSERKFFIDNFTDIAISRLWGYRLIISLEREAIDNLDIINAISNELKYRIKAIERRIGYIDEKPRCLLEIRFCYAMSNDMEIINDYTFTHYYKCSGSAKSGYIIKNKEFAEHSRSWFKSLWSVCTNTKKMDAVRLNISKKLKGIDNRLYRIL